MTNISKIITTLRDAGVNKEDIDAIVRVMKRNRQQIDKLYDKVDELKELNKKVDSPFDDSREITFTIPLQPITKKNSSRIVITPKGKRMILPSKQFVQYQKDAMLFIRSYNIDEPVNIKAKYYMRTRGRVDLTNLNEALHDIMVTRGCLIDDNSKIIVSSDGSRVFYDKNNPRTEVTIQFYKIKEG